MAYVRGLLVLPAATILLSPTAGPASSSVGTFVVGLAAIVLQKAVHGKSFLGMGVHSSRNGLLGVAVAVSCTPAGLLLSDRMPLRLEQWEKRG